MKKIYKSPRIQVSFFPTGNILIVSNPRQLEFTDDSAIHDTDDEEEVL